LNALFLRSAAVTCRRITRCHRLASLARHLPAVARRRQDSIYAFFLDVDFRRINCWPSRRQHRFKRSP
ncbi:MAG TPA: hypothetical protein VGU63_04565, partial [Candidatus Acidoferrales bacterium]|nr:hypothetical protein [Candidatus Acidoferrales bacterium]